MTWIVTIYCTAFSLYCATYGGGMELRGGFETEDKCARWAESFLSDRYYLHQGKFEFAYKCEHKIEPTGYKPARR